MVSMGVFTALILLLFSVVDGATRVWNRSEQRVDAFREARAALSLIARDLQSIVPAPDTAPVDGVADFKCIFINPDPAGTVDVTFAGVASDTFGDRLFFMTAQPAGSQPPGARSDVCLAGYYLDYTAAPSNAMAGSPRTFKLYRHFRDSDAAFQNIKNYSASPQVTASLMQAASSSDEVLARNVVDFRVRAYDAALTPIVPWDARTTPAVLDISITAYNYSAASRFKDAADWMNFTSAKNAPSRQVFSTRVFLPRR